MNKQTKAVLIIGGLGVLGYLAYKMLSKQTPPNLTRAEANKIVNDFLKTEGDGVNSSESFILGATDDYVIPWAQAILMKNCTFPCGANHDQKCWVYLGRVSRSNF
jgi:hypothetical protein